MGELRAALREPSEAYARAEAETTPSAVEIVEPWLEAVDGLALADGIAQVLASHVVFTEPAHVDAAALWVMGSWLMDSWMLWPKLLILSSENGAAKTTLIETMEAFAKQSFVGSNISAAALFRAIEAWQPTLFVDETDCFLYQNEEANGILKRRASPPHRDRNSGRGTCR
jgi:hypothetical protein